MNLSDELLAAAKQAVIARQNWNEARATLRVDGLPPELDVRAREHARVAQRRFHVANDALASAVCLEFGIALPGSEPPWRPSLPPQLERIFSAEAPADGISPLIRNRVLRAREAYNASDASDADTMASARSDYLAALIEYFDTREQDVNDRSAAAE